MSEKYSNLDLSKTKSLLPITNKTTNKILNSDIQSINTF